MRQLKYFIEGKRGKIELTKGTFLSMQKKIKQKIPIKKVRTCKNTGVKYSRIKVQQKKNDIKDIKQNLKKQQIKINKDRSVFGKTLDKICPKTTDSQRSHNKERQTISVSEFNISDQNQNVHYPNQYRDLRSKYYGQTQDYLLHLHAPQMHSCGKTSLCQDNPYRSFMEVEGEMQQSQESTWSMINSNVQNMAISLSIGIYDHVYRK